MRWVITGLAATGLGLTLASAQEQAPNDSELGGSNTHDLRVIVHNDYVETIYAFYANDDDVGDWVPVVSGKQGNVTWTITGCPDGNKSNPPTQTTIYLSTNDQDIPGDIGASEYTYKNEQNGCHLKFNGAEVYDDFGSYELVDKNDTHSDHDRDLTLKPTN